MKFVKLNNGVKIPIIGFGTYFQNTSFTEDSVYLALKNGYRHIDTAKWYNNEVEVGNALKDSKIDRKEIFITSKIECKGYNDAINDVYDTLEKIGTDYLDLVLIHWPNGSMENIMDTYRALEYLYNSNVTRAIGISNFNEDLCEFLINNCNIKPQINQIETHIYFQEKKMNSFLRKNNICHESWSPFAEGLLNVFDDSTIVTLAKKYCKTPSQIILRFFIQNNIVVIPKSTNQKHIAENINIFDFNIDKNDMNIIEKLDRRIQVSGWPSIMSCETKY